MKLVARNAYGPERWKEHRPACQKTPAGCKCYPFSCDVCGEIESSAENVAEHKKWTHPVSTMLERLRAVCAIKGHEPEEYETVCARCGRSAPLDDPNENEPPILCHPCAQEIARSVIEIVRDAVGY